MSYSIQLPAVWIKEKYLDPAGLSTDLLSEIPVAGYGGGPGVQNRWPMYEKATVEKFLKNLRPNYPARESVAETEEEFSLARYRAADDHLQQVARTVIRKVATLGNEKMPSSNDSTWASTVERVEEDMTVPVEPLLVNEKTAASILGVSKRTVFDLEKNGTLTAKRIGKRKLYAVSQLRAFVRGAVA